MHGLESLESRTCLSGGLAVTPFNLTSDGSTPVELMPVRHIETRAAKRPAPFTPSNPQTYIARDWEGIYKVKGAGVSIYFQAFLKQSAKNVTGQMVTFDPDGFPIAYFKVKGTIDQYGKFSLNVTGKNSLPGLGIAKGNSTFNGQVGKNGKMISGSWSGTVQASGMTIKSSGSWYALVF